MKKRPTGNDCILIVPNTITFHDCMICDWLFGFLGLTPCLHDVLDSDKQSCCSSKEQQKSSGILNSYLLIENLSYFIGSSLCKIEVEVWKRHKQTQYPI